MLLDGRRDFEEPVGRAHYLKNVEHLVMALRYHRRLARHHADRIIMMETSPIINEGLP